MYSFFNRCRLPKGSPPRAKKEMDRMLKHWRKQTEAEFAAKPFENRIKFAQDLRAKIEEWKTTDMEPWVLKELESIAQQIVEEGCAHGLALLVDDMNTQLDQWEKQDNPPMREIIRCENDLPILLQVVKGIPEYMRAGATKDLKLIQQRLEKIQE